MLFDAFGVDLDFTEDGGVRGADADVDGGAEATGRSDMMGRDVGIETTTVRGKVDVTFHVQDVQARVGSDFRPVAISDNMASLPITTTAQATTQRLEDPLVFP